MRICSNCGSKITKTCYVNSIDYFCSENCFFKQNNFYPTNKIKFKNLAKEIPLTQKQKEMLLWELSLVPYEKKYNFVLIPKKEKLYFLKELKEDGVKLIDLIAMRRKAFSPLIVNGIKCYIYFFNMLETKEYIRIFHNITKNIKTID